MLFKQKFEAIIVLVTANGRSSQGMVRRLHATFLSLTLYWSVGSSFCWVQLLSARNVTFVFVGVLWGSHQSDYSGSSEDVGVGRGANFAAPSSIHDSRINSPDSTRRIGVLFTPPKSFPIVWLSPSPPVCKEGSEGIHG